MLDTDKLYYIMDYSGNYYRTNDKNELVIAKNVNEAAVFSFAEANKKINVGRKSKFYFMSPVDVACEKQEGEEENPMSGNLEYDLSYIDWKEYLTHFTYVIGALAGYRESLVQAESDVDLKICDILHYIELCDTSDEEAMGLVDLLKECREHRREVKDEIIRLDAFQRTVGTSANVAKEAIKAIQGLETRQYKPRKLSELFGDGIVRMPTASAKSHKDKDLYMSLPIATGMEEEETEEMQLIRRDTAFDGKKNDWMAFAMQQAEFYRNANQYMVNIKLDIEGIEQEIADLMEEIDSSNCNVTQGYKLFKHLKELRTQRKEKETELECLYILTERFDMNVMADECEGNAYELERLLYPEKNADEGEEGQNLESDAQEEDISLVG